MSATTTKRPPELESFLEWLDSLPFNAADEAANAVWWHQCEKLFAMLPPLSFDDLNMEAHGHE